MPGIPGVDTSKPNTARVYDSLLGGNSNFEADRLLAARMTAADRWLPQRVRDNRAFVTAAAARAAAAGISQFLDLGAGLPAHPAVHEAAREVNPAARVCYVDNDPAVVVHADALLARGPGLTAVRADLTRPAEVLGDPGVLEVIRPGEPVCVILASVLHFQDPDTARKVIAGYRAQIMPGSWLVVSVAHYTDTALSARLQRIYSAAGTFRNHSAADLAGWLDGMELVPPGIAESRRWLAGIDCGPPAHPGFMLAAAAVLR